MTDKSPSHPAFDPAVPQRDRHRRFYATIGEAIGRWGDIENLLFRLCDGLLGAKPERSAVVFYRTPGLSAKFNLVEELIHTALDIDSDIGRRWTKLSKRVQPLLEERNMMAHQSHAGLLSSYLSSLPEQVQRERHGVRETIVDDGMAGSILSPSLEYSYRRSKKGKGTKRLLTEADINDHLKELESFDSDFRMYYRDLVKALQEERSP